MNIVIKKNNFKKLDFSPIKKLIDKKIHMIIKKNELLDLLWMNEIVKSTKKQKI